MEPEEVVPPEHTEPGPEALVTDDADLLPIPPPVATPEPTLQAASTPALPVPVVAQETTKEEPEHLARGGNYPSLYDTKATTVVAIVLGVLIVGAIQYHVNRIFSTAKSEHRALTHFVVSMVALVVGAYLCDLIVSGPDTSLLMPSEKETILSFTKDTCLMVFSYYFGTKAAGNKED